MLNISNLIVSVAMALDAGSAVLVTQPEAENFGAVIACAESRVVIGSERAAYVYAIADGRWQLEATLTIDDDPAKRHVFLAIDEDVCLVGSPFEDGGRGAVYVFSRGADGAWTRTQRIDPPPGVVAGGSFGVDLDIRGDVALINTIAVDGGGATLYQYRKTDGLWRMESSHTADAEASAILFGLSDSDVLTAYQVGPRGVAVALTKQQPEVVEPKQVRLANDMHVDWLNVHGPHAVAVGTLPRTQIAVQFLSRPDDDNRLDSGWQESTRLVLARNEESPVVVAKVSERHAVIASAMRSLTVLTMDAAGAWTRTRAFPATPHAMYRPKAVGLTGSWLVVSIEPDEGERSMPVCFIHLDDADQLSTYIWGRLSTGEIVGQLDRDDIVERLIRIAHARRAARAAGDAEAQAMLYSDFNKLMRRHQAIRSDR